MTSPRKVGLFHAEYDRHTDDRLRLFRAIAEVIPPSTRVLYPGSYVDIAPSIRFDHVTYVDTDNRAARFFGEIDAVAGLIAAKRTSSGESAGSPNMAFLHSDYREPLPLEPGSVGLLISLYAGFISEHCTDYLASGGTLLVNASHGDAAMASLDPRYRLTGVVISRDDRYRVESEELDGYLVPKKPQVITAESLHESGRGVGCTRSPFAYLFTKLA